MASNLKQVEQDIGEALLLFSRSIAVYGEELAAKNHKILAGGLEYRRAHDELCLLFRLCYQVLYNGRSQPLDIATRPAGDGTPAYLLNAIVTEATIIARSDISKGVAIDIDMHYASIDRVNDCFDDAVTALESWTKVLNTRGATAPSSVNNRTEGDAQDHRILSAPLAATTTLPDHSHNAKACNNVGNIPTYCAKNENALVNRGATNQTTTFNLAVFKRLKSGNHGEKNFGAADNVPMEIHLTQKKASKNGGPKKSIITTNLHNHGIEEQARQFSHNAAWEMSLTDAASTMLVTLVVLWRKETSAFARRPDVEARTEVLATDIGQLVALAVIVKDHAEQEAIDGGWPESDEKWEWDTKYPDVKALVTYRRI